MPSSRPRLSRDSVLRTAVELADAEGVDAISMRRLGALLGVEAMSLYNHVANKDDVLDGLVDLVASDFPRPDATAPWHTALRDAAIAAHEILLRHTWACTLSLSRPRLGPGRLGYTDAIIGTMRRGGLSNQLIHDALHALDSHIYAFTMQEIGLHAGFDAMGPDVAAIRAGERDDDYPHIVAVIPHAVHDHQAEYEFVLDLLLDGIRGRATSA